MNNEFKKSKSNNETRYTLESMTAGATGSGSVATAPSSLGKVQKRGNILAQEAGKDKVPATTPRNFVAKNAKSSGAGAHKDKKKEQKQGAAKHKKPYMESLRTKIDQLKSKLAEAGMPFRGVGGAFNRGDDERHDLDPTEWYIVKDGKMFKTSVYPNQVQLAIAQGYSRTRDEAKAKAGKQGTAEGVRDLGYDAQSLIMKLRRDVEEKRLQPTPQAVLAAARELAGDMEFAPQLLVKQVLGQGVAEATGDERFDTMMGKITGGAGARQGVDNLNKSLTARTGSDPETALAKWGQEFIKWLEDICRNFSRQGVDRFNKLKKLSEFEDGGETMAHWLIEVAKQTKTSGITLADIQEFSSEFNTHGMWPWQQFPIAWSQNEWQDYKDQWTGPDGYIANLRHSPEQGVAEAVEDRTSYQVAKILSDRGIKYDPAQENELINAIGMVLVKELNMTPKEARYLISYDEDFVADTLGELRSMEQSVAEVDVYMESLAYSLQQVLSEKAVSKKQQKFMGMVHAAQKGEKPASKEVAKVAKDMGKKDARDFASTKHKGLPEKKKSKK
jgi:hypothetical protein